MLSAFMGHALRQQRRAAAARARTRSRLLIGPPQVARHPEYMQVWLKPHRVTVRLQVEGNVSGHARRAAVLGTVTTIALVAASAAWAHARVSPAVSLVGKLQLYSLAIPTEKEGLTTAKIVLTVPRGFGIDSFVPAPGWKQSIVAAGQGDNAVVQQVTWSGGKVPTGEDSLFQFLAQPAHSGTYTFHVQQTYSDGSIVDWAGPESADAPAPTISAVSSIGGGSSWLPVAGIVLGALALLVAIAVLLRGGSGGAGREGRELV